MNDQSVDIRMCARPTRIACLFNREQHTTAHLQDILRFACTQWGGRSHLYVPFSDTGISDDWYRLLRFHDPDKIVVLGDMSANSVQDLYHHIQPLEFWHGIYPPNGMAEHSRLRSALGSASIRCFADAVRNRGQSKGIFRLCDQDLEHDGDLLMFCLMNFGVWPKSIADAFTDPPASNPFSRDGTQLFLWLRQFSHVVFPLDITEFAAGQTYYGVPEDAFQLGLHVVVGNSLDDLLYFLSRRAVPRGFQGYDSVWLPSKWAQSDAMMSVFLSWLTGLQSLSVGTRFKVVSYSIPADQLSLYVERLRQYTDRQFTAHHLSTDALPFSDTSDNFHNIWNAPSHTQLGPMNAHSLGQMINAPTPDGLEAVPGHRASWSIDIEISNPTNTRNWTFSNFPLRVPRKLGVSGLFCSRGNSRVTASGLICSTVDWYNREIVLRTPSADQVLRTATQHRSVHDEQSVTLRTEPSAFGVVRQGDTGRRLQAVLDLWGGLTDAWQTLNDVRWRNIFVQLFGQDLEEQVVDVLHKRFAEAKPGAPVPEKVASAIVDKLVRFKGESGDMTFDEMRKKWYANLKYSLYPHEGKIDFQNQLNELLKRKIFLQGANVVCHNCSTTSWLSIDELSMSIRCSACATDIAVGLLEHSYRLNGLVFNALRLEGSMQVLETLQSLRLQSNNHFLFITGQELFLREEKTAYTDVDIAALRDDETIFAEVKSSSSGIRHIDVEKTFRVLNEFHPDRFVVAAPKAAFDADALMFLHQLEARCVPYVDTFERMHLAW